MDLLEFFKKNPENFDIYISQLKNTVNNSENKYSDSIPKKTIFCSIISFTFGFFISKYLSR